MKFLCFSVLLILGCTANEPKPEDKILDFGAFRMVTPNGWKKINVQGIDSYIGRIAIDNTDTLTFDLGWYSNTLTEPEPRIIDLSLLNHEDVFDTTGVIIVDSQKNIDPDQYKKNNISWDTIDGRKAKIIFPIRSGIGTTGIYIDSLWRSGSGVDRFNLYGENLKPVNEKRLLQALKTLKFHKAK